MSAPSSLGYKSAVQTIGETAANMRIGIILPGFSANADDWCIPALRNLVQRLALTDDVRVLALRYPGSSARYTVFGADVIALGGGTCRGVGSANLWRRGIAVIAA